MAKRKDNNKRVLQNGESQRANGTYMYRYTDLMGKRKTIYAKTLDELRHKERDIQIKIEQGIVDSDATLKDIFPCFIARKKKFPKSCEIYNRIFRNQLEKSILFNTPLCKLKKDLVFGFYAEQSEKYSKSVIKHMHTIIRNCFEIAIDNDLIMKNLTNGILQNIELKEPKKIVALTKAQTETLFKIFNDDKPHTAAIRFMLFTGTRFCEMAAITWQDIDFKNKYVDINKHVIIKDNQSIIERGSKTDAGVRKIPLSNEAIQFLKDLKSRVVFENSSTECCGYKGFLFLTCHKQIWKGSNLDCTIQDRIKRYNKRTESDFPIIGSHVLRHTFCTRLAEKGIKPDALMKIMGHNDYQLTQSVYIDVEEDFVFEEFRKCM